MTLAIENETVGDLLREWRRRRRFSQLDLALEADVSARHVSFIESGRSSASRSLLLRLAETLALPLRERNRLLLAGGYAPHFADRPFDAPDMQAAMAAVRDVLAAYAPYPALAIDRYWTLVAANDAVFPLLAGVAPHLLEPPVNVLRLSLAPDGLAPFILNLSEWREHVLERVHRDAVSQGDPELERLHDELRRMGPHGTKPARGAATAISTAARIATPLVLRHPSSGQQLSFLSTTTVFGTATNVALAELTLEGFLPADDATRMALTGAA